MTHSVNSSQPRSPATPIQQAHEQSGHGGRNGGYAWAQLHRLPVTQGNAATATAECPPRQPPRPTPSPHCGTIPQADQQFSQWQADYTGWLPSWKGHCFVLNGIDTLGMDLPLLNAMLLPKLPSMDLQNTLFYYHGIPYNIISDKKKTHFTANEMQQ